MPFPPFATSRRRVIALGTFAAVLAFVVGLATGYLGPGDPGNDSVEAGFARDMSTHHAQAVEMAMVAWQHGTDAEVRELGYDIALTQENQIGIMQTWLKQWHLDPTGDQPKMAWMGASDEVTADGLMPGMATQAQMNELHQATGNQVDILFCQLMLRHHLGGIHMADEILSRSHDQQVHDLATAMKNGQQNEVTVLKNLLTKLGAQPLAS